MFISSVAQQGLTELKDKLWKMLNDYIIKKTVSIETVFVSINFYFKFFGMTRKFRVYMLHMS
jgi:hypothetical protein